VFVFGSGLAPELLVGTATHHGCFNNQI